MFNIDFVMLLIICELSMLVLQKVNKPYMQYILLLRILITLDITVFKINFRKVI